MALTRKMLKAMGIDEDKIDQIIDEHAESVDALKKQRDEAREQAEGTEEIRKQLEDARSELEASRSDGYKAKYDELKGEFDGYKADVEAKAAQAEARSLFKAQVEALGITGSRADSIVRATDLGAFEVKDGAYTDPDAVKASIEKEWADFIPKKTTEGAQVAHPPAQSGGAVTKEQFAGMSIRQRNELYNTDRAAYEALARD